MIAPIYKELSNIYDDVVFLKVDVDENPETAANYNVSAMPTFVSRFGSLRRTWNRFLPDCFNPLHLKNSHNFFLGTIPIEQIFIKGGVVVERVM